MKLDKYSYKTRFIPTLIAGLPAVYTLIIFFEDYVSTLSMMWGIMVYCGFYILLSNFSREFGKNLELKLKREWNGFPSSTLLTQKSSLNKITVKRYHNKLKVLLPNISLPTALDEHLKPTESNLIYDSCIDFLKEQTRDTKKYKILFEENINYGFRRNLRGLKPIAIIIILINITLIIGRLYYNLHYLELFEFSWVFPLFINLIFLLLWLFLITKNFVKKQSYNYAVRLLSTLDSL